MGDQASGARLISHFSGFTEHLFLPVGVYYRVMKGKNTLVLAVSDRIIHSNVSLLLLSSIPLYYLNY